MMDAVTKVHVRFKAVLEPPYQGILQGELVVRSVWQISGKGN
jgi:hypothetical protein